MTDAHLVLDNLSVRYGNSLALDRLSAVIAKGELVALLGPSGCGKTTTLRAIAGFVEPAAGTIRIGGVDVTETPVHQRNIGVVFQSYALFSHLTAIENVGFGLRMRHVARQERLDRAQAALSLVGLGALGDRYPSQLSGGQQQRVALARALAIEPAILLLDEPLSNLDTHLRAGMRDEIRSLQQRLGITTILVTHDQEEALAVSDRVVLLDGGHLIEVGTPTQLCNAPVHPFTAVFLGQRTVIEGVVVDGVFEAPGVKYVGAPPDATRIVLRAARLRLGAADGPLELSGRVVSRTFLGDVLGLDLETPSGLVRVTQSSLDDAPQIGDPSAVTALSGGVSFIS